MFLDSSRKQIYSEIKIDSFETTAINLNDIPKNTSYITAAFSKNLEKITGNFNDLIHSIDFSWCDKLEELPPFPKYLTYLNLRSCKNLKKLPPLPDSLTYIILKGCSNLIDSPELISQLDYLAEKNSNNKEFRLYIPKHIYKSFQIFGINKYLINAYKNYYSLNPDMNNVEPNLEDNAKFATLILFNRLVNESIEERGGFKNIIHPILQIVDIIFNNPKILEFTEELSKTYLSACINQPVAGFTEIANIINISTKLDIESKLEEARAIMCINLIKNEVNKLEVGLEVEVELNNAIINEINNYLLEKEIIHKSWIGIPNKIAHQETIQSFLTQNNINKILELVEKELEKPLEMVAEYLCESYLQDFWITQSLNQEEINKINQPTEDIKKKIADIELNDPEFTNYAENLKNIEIKCKEEILIKSKEATLIALKKMQEIPEEKPNQNSVKVFNIMRQKLLNKNEL